MIKTPASRSTLNVISVFAFNNQIRLVAISHWNIHTPNTPLYYIEIFLKILDNEKYGFLIETFLQKHRNEWERHHLQVNFKSWLISNTFKVLISITFYQSMEADILIVLLQLHLACMVFLKDVLWVSSIPTL